MSSMNYPKAVFFDLDGVILDTESLYLDLMLKYNKKQKLFISRDFYLKNILGKSQMEISKILQNEWKEKYNKEKYWDGLLKYREDYLNNNKIKSKIGFRKLLKYLKNNNCYIGIVSSNSLKLVEKLLNNANINKDDFDLIVTRENVDKLKPFPDLYMFAINKSKIKKSDIIAIEDSEVGLISAINSKINVVYVPDIKLDLDKLDSKNITIKKTLYDVKTYLIEIGEKYGNVKRKKIQ